MVAAKEKTLDIQRRSNIKRMHNESAHPTATKKPSTVINRISSYDFTARKFQKSPIGTSEKIHLIVHVGAHTKPRKYTGENVVDLRRLHWGPEMSFYRAYFVPGDTDPLGLAKRKVCCKFRGGSGLPPYYLIHTWEHKCDDQFDAATCCKKYAHWWRHHRPDLVYVDSFDGGCSTKPNPTDDTALALQVLVVTTGTTTKKGPCGKVTRTPHPIAKCVTAAVATSVFIYVATRPRNITDCPPDPENGRTWCCRAKGTSQRGPGPNCPDTFEAVGCDKTESLAAKAAKKAVNHESPTGCWYGHQAIKECWKQ